MWCAQPSVSAAPSGRVSVTVATSATLLASGQSVRLRGRVSAARSRAVVHLQRHTGRGWRNVKSDRLDSRGRYSIRVTPTIGSWNYRVVAAGYGRLRWGGSTPTNVQVLPCTPMQKPTARTAAWFSHPGEKSASQISRNVGRLVCSAARGATVDIAMYFIRYSSGKDLQALMRPLRAIARDRGVRINFLLEGKVYQPGSPLHPTLAILRKFAHVTLCNYGCHNRRQPPSSGGTPAIMHHKFVTISDMAWRPGVDPVVVDSSANWSHAQLATVWQSAVMLYDDVSLTRQFDIQWRLLRTCATSCGSWAARARSLGLSADAYGLRDTSGLWTDQVERERLGGPGRGTGVTFSPRTDVDPLALALRDYTCTAAHHTVRVAHMFVTRGRGPVIRALGRLRTQGCDVRVIVSNPGGALQAQGIDELRAAGVSTTCVSRLHDKFILVDAVRSSTQRPDHALWMGSQSLGGNALRANDESSLRVSTADASGTAVAENTSLYRAYGRDWKAIDHVVHACNHEPDGELSAVANSLTPNPHDTVLPQ